MRVIVQRVKSAAVAVDGENVGKIGSGLLVLAGFEATHLGFLFRLTGVEFLPLFIKGIEVHAPGYDQLLKDERNQFFAETSQDDFIQLLSLGIADLRVSL